MGKLDLNYLKVHVFDGEKFAVWKFYMKICFDVEDVMPIVDGTLPKPADGASEAEKAAWQKGNNLARLMISLSVSLSVLENLIHCSTAACMWATLCEIYQDDIYMIQKSFFEYEMSRGDSINAHVKYGKPPTRSKTTSSRRHDASFR